MRIYYSSQASKDYSHREKVPNTDDDTDKERGINGTLHNPAHRKTFYERYHVDSFKQWVDKVRQL